MVHLRAEVIIDIERNLSRKDLENEDYFPHYVQTLEPAPTPKSQTTDDRLAALESSAEETHARVKNIEGLLRELHAHATGTLP